MLQVTIPGVEYYDGETETFIETKSQTLQLEHSLISISKWESKWKKPFLSRTQRTFEESTDYIRCMTITPNVDVEVYSRIPQNVFEEVNNYIEDSMTATTINTINQRRSRVETVTAEVVYYWMISLNIPFECQKWHFNRLITLIQVCNIKSGPEKKMSKKQTLEKNRELNAARKQSLHTRG